MPNKPPFVTTAQMAEFILLTADHPNGAVCAVRRMLTYELVRRKDPVRRGGRPRLYHGDPKERNRASAALYRAKKKTLVEVSAVSDNSDVPQLTLETKKEKR